MNDHPAHDHGAAAGPGTQIDPVCGMTVDPLDRPDLHLELDGRTFWFCGKGCLLEFRDSPATYLDPNYTPQGM